MTTTTAPAVRLDLHIAAALADNTPYRTSSDTLIDAAAARIAFLDAGPCVTCRIGCDCEAGTFGCEHYGCWGRARVHTTSTCPTAEHARSLRR